MSRDRIGGNNPPVILELTDDQARFLLAQSEEAMMIGMQLLTGVSRGNQEKLVASIEGFRPIRDKLKAAGVRVE